MNWRVQLKQKHAPVPMDVRNVQQVSIVFFRLSSSIYLSSTAILLLDKYRNQNIARRGYSEKVNESPMFTISSIIMDWFLEYRDADMDNIYSSNNRPQGYETTQ